jgi:hypothetical protein
MIIYANSTEYERIEKEKYERFKQDLLKEMGYRSPEDMLDPEEAAKFIGMRVDDNKGWKVRMYGIKGLPYHKIEGVGNRYKMKDLVEYVESRRVKR